MSVFIILSGGIAMAGESVEPDLCGNNDEFTTDFRIEDCKFKTKGENPYFILRPGYRVVLESDEEKSVETVLRDTKRIKFDGRRIRTRVLEERAFEWEEGEDGEEEDAKYYCPGIGLVQDQNLELVSYGYVDDDDDDDDDDDGKDNKGWRK